MNIDDLFLQKMLSIWCRTPESFTAQKFFYDETGNDSHVGINSRGILNLTDPFSIFVIGGVVADDELSCEELKLALGRTGKNELKSTHIFKGSFLSGIEKDTTSRLLKLIDGKRWPLHFLIMQPLYYSFVDIVDSIGFDPAQHHVLKSSLYRVLRSDLDGSVKLLRSFGYPNVVARRKDEFVMKIKDCVETYLNLHQHDENVEALHEFLACATPCEFSFLVGEKQNEWLQDYTQFYLEGLTSFPLSTHIFDENKKVENKLRKMGITFLDNIVEWQMIDSKSCAMIQLCDLIVCLLRKFVMELDCDVAFHPQLWIQKLSVPGQNNLRLLLNMINNAAARNPLMFQRIIPQDLSKRMDDVALSLS